MKNNSKQNIHAKNWQSENIMVHSSPEPTGFLSITHAFSVTDRKPMGSDDVVHYVEQPLTQFFFLNNEWF